jgi:hypothetical protein
MKLWKTLLIVASVAILPFALVGVGQAQQLTCWGLRPNLPEKTEFTNYSEQHSPQEHEDVTERTSETDDYTENEDDKEDVGAR